MLQRNVLAALTRQRGLRMPHRMPVHERAAPDVHAGQPDAVTVFQQRGMGQVFSHAPIDRVLAISQRRAPALAQIAHPIVQNHTFGQRGQRLRQRLQALQRQRLEPMARPVDDRRSASP